MAFALAVEILFAEVGMAALQHHSEKTKFIFGGQTRHKVETAAARFRIKEESSALFATLFQARRA
jgi:hypothetical protein